MALLLYSGQRRGDVVRMGRQQSATAYCRSARRKPATSWKSRCTRRSPRSSPRHRSPDRLTFLTSVTGAAFSSASFGNVFRDWCNEADLPKRCSSHGLRKAACRRLAEAGCSEHEIASISGHESLAEVRRYTRAASRVKLAKSAMATVRRPSRSASTHHQCYRRHPDKPRDCRPAALLDDLLAASRLPRFVEAATGSRPRRLG